MNSLELSTNVAHDVARWAKGRLVLVSVALLAGVLLSAGATLVDTPAAAAFLPDPTGPLWTPVVGFVPDASCGTRCAPVAPPGQLPARPHRPAVDARVSLHATMTRQTTTASSSSVELPREGEASWIQCSCRQ